MTDKLFNDYKNFNLDTLIKDYEKVYKLYEDAKTTKKRINKTKVEYESQLIDIAIDILSNIDLYDLNFYNEYPVHIAIEYNDEKERWEIEWD